MVKKLSNLIGSWAFLLGIGLALIVGILAGMDKVDLRTENLVLVLVVIGIIIGLFNITSKEVSPFLMSGIVLILASIFGASVLATIPILSATLNTLLIIFIPTTIVVAIRNVFNLAKN